MSKEYENIKEMIKSLSIDGKFKEDALSEIENNTKAKSLFIFKCFHKNGTISRFDIFIYRLFYWRWNKLLKKDKKLRDLFHDWIHGFEDKK